MNIFSEQPKVLVIDDEPDNFDVIEALLHKENYQLNYASSGQKGIDRLPAIQPDVILLDVMMPEIDGIEVCRQLKNNSQWQHIPILMVTALNAKEDLAKCMGAGADDFISKPVNGLELRARVRSAVRISQQYQNIQDLCQRVQEGNEHLDKFNKMLDEEVQSQTAQLQQMIYQDQLTHLPNRLSLLRQLKKLMQNRHTLSEVQFAVFYIDCDGFQQINSSWGYEVGNKLLVAIAQRLQEVLRPRDFLARLGADEFCLVCKNLTSLLETQQLANTILAVFNQPFAIGDDKIFITAGLGIAFDHARYQQAEEILQDADTAMHRAKTKGKGHYQTFDIQMQKQVVDQLQMQQDLRYALAKQELVVSYQPIVELAHGNICGLEAQLNWHHPERGTLPLAEFLPYMEETGLSIPVGMMLLRKACQHLQTLAKSGFNHITIHVPLSIKQFAYPNLLKEIEQLLSGLSIDPELLSFEITEDAIAQNSNAAEIINQLRKQKLRVSIDNFGIQASSLKNLHQITVDNIRIDQTFLHSMAVNFRSAEIVAAIIKLAKAINTTVTANGIEKQSQIAYLREFGCEYGQGQLCSPALDATAVMALLNRRQPVFSK